jgi:outer membrane receptor protein involved in Fe transport
MKNFTHAWFILLFGCLHLSLSAFGQLNISGKVQESKGTPFPFANVLLLSSKDSALVKGLLTGDKGTYLFENIKPGNYLIAASMVGYKKTYSPSFSVTATQGTHQVKALILLEGNTQLKEVSVVAQKPLFEQHLDRLVVNVQNSIVAAGATALEVLERSPGITVNRQSNALSISGKDGVVVMINGKQSRVPMATIIQMLSGMNASNIDKIEIITTPSAQYDAEGNAGIINLVLKKNENYGTNGAYTLTMGYGWYAKPAGTFNINHRTEKINVYSDYSFMRNHSFQRIETSRQVYYINELTQTNSLNRRQPIRTNHTARLGFDINLNPSTTFSGLLSGFSDKFQTGPVDEKGFSQIRKNNIIQSTVATAHQEVNHWRHLMGNLNLNHKLTPSQELSLDMDYLYYYDRNPHHYTNDYTYFEPAETRQEQLDMKKTTPIHLWVSKADYQNNIGEQTKVEAGFKSTISRLQNKVVVQDFIEDSWQPNTEFSQHIRMLENIGAAYVNFNHQLPQQIKLQTGLRYEYTHTDLSTVDNQPLVSRRYGNLFPSIFASRDVTKKSSLQLSYSRRITRPTYNNLAPFVYFIDPNTFLSGNTNLKPAITDALQATYRFQESYLLTLGYSYDKTPIVAWQIHLDSATNKQYARAENLKHAHNYSLNFSVPVSLTGWWQIQSNFLGVWINNLGVYDGREVSLQGGYGRVNVNQTFKLPKDFSAEVSGFYQTRSPFGISYIKALGALNAGLQKKLAKDKGVFRLSVDDIFWTLRFRILTDQEALNLYSYFNGAFSEPRVVRLTFSRNFGNQKMKAATRRETSSEEERKRANSN